MLRKPVVHVFHFGRSFSRVDSNALPRHTVKSRRTINPYGKCSLKSVDELIHIGHRMRRIALQSAIGGMSLSLIGIFEVMLEPRSQSPTPKTIGICKTLAPCTPMLGVLVSPGVPLILVTVILFNMNLCAVLPGAHFFLVETSIRRVRPLRLSLAGQLLIYL